MQKTKGFTPLEVRGHQKKYNKNKLLTGFTLIELLVVIAIIGILSSIVLFNVTQYINTSKDASISGNLATLIPAGEVYYNISQNTYDGFCASDVAKKAFSQIPPLSSSNCLNINSVGVPCCKDASDKWAACAQEFRNNAKAYCVDSRGVQKEINNSSCTSTIALCP